MNIWNILPFIRLLIAFLGGLLVAINYPQFPDFHFAFFAITLIAYFLLFKIFRKNYKWRFLIGVPIVFFFGLFGIKLVKLNTELNYTNHFSKQTFNSYLIKITDSPKLKTKTLKFTGEVIQVENGKKWERTTGKILVYISLNSKSKKLKYGDVILCNSPVVETPAPKNPYEFNYKKYLAFHQIFKQTYIAPKNWTFTGINQGNIVLRNTYKLRNFLLGQIAKHHVQGDEFAIGSALILGYEDDLSGEVVSSFAATGALHVLSVSGLHVGIVFIVLNFFLKYLGERKRAQLFRFLIALTGLWFYAVLTGLSPSVCRAAVMFTLISIGKFYNKDTNTLNIVGCSAFLILCVNPFILTEVGFQLSYLAVIGIVTLHKKFYELIPSFKNKLFESIWSITSVSVAAQLVTAPLGLLYFHQFPVYFLLSNLIVIPLSTLVLYNGMLLMVISSVPFVGAPTAWLLHFILFVLKSSVNFFEQLPFALIENISITTVETFILYGIILNLVLYWLNKNIRVLKIALILAVSLGAFQIYEKAIQKQQSFMVVYAVSKHSAIDIVQGQNSLFIADSLLLADKEKIRFHILPNWINNGINKKSIYSNNQNFTYNYAQVSTLYPYLVVNNKVILLTGKRFENFSELKYRPDVIVLNKNNKHRFNTLIQLFPEAFFVCDGTVSVFTFQKLTDKHKNIKISSVLKDAAITIKV